MEAQSPAKPATTVRERGVLLRELGCSADKASRPRLLPSSCSGSLTFLVGQDVALFLQGLEIKLQELLGLAGFLSLVKHLLERALQPLDGGTALAEFLSQLSTRDVDECLASDKGSEKAQGRR